MDTHLPVPGEVFGLDADLLAIRDMTRGFAIEQLRPHAVEWDQAKLFPVDAIRQAAALGMGGIYVREDAGEVLGLGGPDPMLAFGGCGHPLHG